MRYENGFTLHKGTGFLVIALFICAMQFITPKVYGQCPPGYNSGVYSITINANPLCSLTVEYCWKMNGSVVEIITGRTYLIADQNSPCLNQTLAQLVNTYIGEIGAQALDQAGPGYEVPPCPSNARVFRISFGGCRTDDIPMIMHGYDQNGTPYLYMGKINFKCETTYRCWKSYSICNNGTPTNPIIVTTYIGYEIEGEPCVNGTFTYNSQHPFLALDGVNDKTVPCIPESCP